MVGELEAYTTFTNAQTNTLQENVVAYVQHFIDQISQYKDQLKYRMHYDIKFHTEVSELTMLLKKLTARINSFSEKTSDAITDAIPDERSTTQVIRKL